MHVRLLLALVFVSACVVTRAPRVEERPRWSLIAPASYAASCIEGAAWIRMSGKTGIGLSLRLRSRGDCSFAIRGSRLVVGTHPIVTGSLAEIRLPGRSQLYAWLPVKFDNDALWNDDRNDATLELDVVVAGQPTATWSIPVHQR
ncbi:hypothetical protein BH11MYX3_BH11MYX3_40190 [soil metagenome]